MGWVICMYEWEKEWEDMSECLGRAGFEMKAGGPSGKMEKNEEDSNRLRNTHLLSHII
jgi:hypothetical protein